MRELQEGRDFNVEDGLVVFTARYLLERGYCCESGCRHCPWGFRKPPREESPPDQTPPPGAAES